MNTIVTLLILPFIVLIQIVFILNEIIFSLSNKLSSNKKESNDHQEEKPKKIKKVSIAVLNWNGRHLLQKYLPSVLAAIKNCKLPCELMVIDNGSSDDSIPFIEQKYPQIKVLALKKNLYFAGGNNKAIGSVNGDIIVFLNNDMKVDRDFLNPLIDGFTDESVFAVTSRIKFPKDKRQEETGKTSAKWKNFKIITGHEKISRDSKEYLPVFWAGGGSSAFDRKKLLEIGGFDPLYNPFYYEDTDLSYRAWKRGWQILLATKSIVCHEHRATNSKRYDKAYIDTSIEKNGILFIWKNITDFKYFFPYILILPIFINNKLAEFGVIKGLKIIFSAFKQLPEALFKRNKTRKTHKLTDKLIFKITSDIFEYNRIFHSPRKVKKGDKLNLLFVTPYIPCEKIHAGGQRMYKIISELAKRHTISLVMPEINNKSKYKKTAQIEKAYIAKLKKMCKKIKQYSIHSLSRWEKFLNKAYKWPSLEYERSGIDQLIKEFLLEDEFDAVIYEYSLTATILPQNLKEVKILTDHESVYLSTLKMIKRKKNPVEKFNLWHYSNQQKKFLKKVYGNFDRIIFISKTDEAAAKKIDPKLKTETIPTGVDLSYFKKNGTSKSNSLLYCGSFSHEPNVEAVKYFIKNIWPKAKSKIKDLKLYIVGNLGKEKLNHLGKISKDIIITDWVKDIRPYLAKSQIFVNPIITGAGMRGKILEAMSMGKPVISTSLGTAGLEVAHKKNIWIADSPKKFAGAINELIKDKGLRKLISGNGRKMVKEKYDWDTLIDKFDKILNKTIEEKRKEYI